MQTSWYHWQGNILYLQVKIQPRASRDQIVGIHGNALKISLTSPPVEGQANAYLIKYLAKVFGVTQRQIEIVQGLKSRHKTLKIISPSKLPEIIEK